LANDAWHLIARDELDAGDASKPKLKLRRSALKVEHVRLYCAISKIRKLGDAGGPGDLMYLTRCASTGLFRQPIEVRRCSLGRPAAHEVRVSDNSAYFDVANAQTPRKVLVAFHIGDMHAPQQDRRKVCSLMTQEFASAITEAREALTSAAVGVPPVSPFEVAERSRRSPAAGVRI
jgi:hypothetical protein